MSYKPLNQRNYKSFCDSNQGHTAGRLSEDRLYHPVWLMKNAQLLRMLHSRDYEWMSEYCIRHKL